MSKVSDVYFVFATPRSGHHAVAQWICSQYPGLICINNDCKASVGSGFLKDNGRSRDDKYRFDNPGERSAEMFTMEGCRLTDFVKHEVHKYSQFEGKSIRVVLVVRDHYNWLASMLRGGRDPGNGIICWRQLMKEITGRDCLLPPELKESAVVVNFNRWHESEDYRRSITEELGFDFKDEWKSHVPCFGGGSSFDGLSMDGKGGEMKVNERWRDYRTDGRFKNLSMDPKMVSLTREYFDFEPMSKVFIVYPHGLGDCILATPALRALKRTGCHVGIAIQERFKSSRVFDACPYVDEIFYTKDVWNDFSSVDKGKRKVLDRCEEVASQRGYNRCVFVWHPKGRGKIRSVAEILGVSIEGDERTEVFISDQDIEEAYPLFPLVDYGFVQTSTGVPQKDLPEGYGEEWLRRRLGVKEVIEVGKDFKYDDISLGAQFLLMGAAKGVCIPDSVFYHAACAMGKRVDLVYFARGKDIYNMVKPLHQVEENVVFQLESWNGKD